MNSEKPIGDVAGKTTIVVGASRGLGRGMATALAEAGASVVAVARDAASIESLADSHVGIKSEVGDASNPALSGRLIEDYEPDVIVLVAGAVPTIHPLQHQTWETFSANWQSDVQIAFYWLREALLKPLRPGSRVIVISSGAALVGSPLSGGYAGAKATQRFITGYAQEEAQRAGLGIVFTSVLPQITPLTGVGEPAVRAYAERNGQTEQEYMAQRGEPLTPEMAGAAIVELARKDEAALVPAYLLSGAGLNELPAAA